MQLLFYCVFLSFWGITIRVCISGHIILYPNSGSYQSGKMDVLVSISAELKYHNMFECLETFSIPFEVRLYVLLVFCKGIFTKVAHD